MDDISENNPHLDEMEERGWAWIQRGVLTDNHGAPYTDDEYAADISRGLDSAEINDNPAPAEQELLIVSWE